MSRRISCSLFLVVGLVFSSRAKRFPCQTFADRQVVFTSERKNVKRFTANMYSVSKQVTCHLEEDLQMRKTQAIHHTGAAILQMLFQVSLVVFVSSWFEAKCVL